MLLKLVITNSKTYLEGDNPEALGCIREVCTFDYTYYGMDFSLRPPRVGKKTDSINYFDIKTKSFPSGWVSRVVKSFKEEGIEFKWIDKRVIPTDKFDYEAKGLYSLRPEYQVPALEAAIKKTRGIIAHATGGGKTVLIYHLLNHFKLKSLIMVPDLNLLYQMYKGATDDDEALIDFFPEEHCGIVGDGIFNPSTITVATVQTLWNGLKSGDPETMKLINSVDFLAIDEAHHLSIAGRNKIKNSYYNIVQATNAYYRYGFTATPGPIESLERSLLEGGTGKMIHRVTSSQLIDWGYLTPPEVHIFPITGMKRIRDWKTAYDLNILDNPVRNQLIADEALRLNEEGKTVLVIVKRVEDHGVILNEMIPGSELMTGKTSTDERSRLMTAFANKEIMTLVSTVIKEGTNIPSMDAVIIAAGGKSIKAITQWIGRGLRKSAGKLKTIIIDFYDGDNGILQKHSERRISVYDGEAAFKVIHHDEVVNANKATV